MEQVMEGGMRFGPAYSCHIRMRYVLSSPQEGTVGGYN